MNSNNFVSSPAAAAPECHAEQRVSRVDYQIVHRGQRHLRIRIPHLAKDPRFAERLPQRMSELFQKAAVRVNAAAQSLSIEYDPNLISSTEIEAQLSPCLQALMQASSPPPPPPIPPLVTQRTVGWKIFHQTPWRIRIQVPRLKEDADYASRLLTLAKSIPGVSEVRMNQRIASIAIDFDTHLPISQVTKARQSFFEVLDQALRVDVIALTTECSDRSVPEESEIWQRLGLPALSLALGLGSLLGLPIPGGFLFGIILFAAIPVFQRAWKAIVSEGQLNIDFLDGLAISLHTWIGGYFPATLMLGLIEGGEFIRDMTARSSERASLDLLDCLNGEVLVERQGQTLRIPGKAVQQGDLVLLYPGDQIPVDGYITRGTALVDQCKLTGESVPVTRAEGDEVFASTLVVDGHFCVLAERIGSNTRAGVILSLVESAPVHDTRIENYAANVANQLVVPTLLAAAAVGVSSGNINRAIALLTLDLGTGIRISVPTTILSALTYAARNGLFIRSGRAIEILAKIDTVVFDKTGTLTEGHAGVTAILPLQPQLTDAELLSLAATAEQGLTHPIAEAIVRHHREADLPLYDCESWEYKVGLGVTVIIKGVKLLVGSQRFLVQEGVDLATLRQRHPHVESGGHSPVYIAGDGELLGVILYSDPVRPESQEVIQELHELGITSYMLSGDITRVAHAVAHDLNIAPDCVYAEAFPERKVEVVKALHDSGKTVAFCGDGINDSAALAYADVSISFAGATDIARETADVVLMENNLRSLIHGIRIARQAMEIVWQNTALVAVPNLSAVAAGVLFALDPVLAIVINNGSAILAELNGLRPLLGPGNLSPLQQSLSADALSQEITRWQEQPEQMITSTSSLSVNEPAASEPAVSTTAATVFSPNQDAQDANRSAGLTQSELARRLGVAAKTLTRRRNSRSFAEWSQQKDPEKLSWNYQPDAQRFYPVSESQEAVERRSSQQRSHEHSSQSYPSRDPRPSRPQKPRLKSVS